MIPVKENTKRKQTTVLTTNKTHVVIVPDTIRDTKEMLFIYVFLTFQ